MSSADPHDTKLMLWHIACRTRERAPIRGVRVYAGPPGYWKVVLPARGIGAAVITGIVGALWSGFIIKEETESPLSLHWFALGILSLFVVLGLGLLLFSAWLFLSRRSWLVGPDLLVVQEGFLKGFQTEWKVRGARLCVCAPRNYQRQDESGDVHGWELNVGGGRSVPISNPPRHWNAESEDGYWMTLCDFGDFDRGARKADALGRWLAERTGWEFTSNYTELRQGVSVMNSKQSRKRIMGPCHYRSKCGGFELDLPARWTVEMEEANPHMEWTLPLVINTAGKPGCVVWVWMNRRSTEQRDTIALLPGYGARGGPAELCLDAVPGAAVPAPAALIEQYTSQAAKLSPDHRLAYSAEITVAGQPAAFLAYTRIESGGEQVGEISVCFPSGGAIFQIEYMGSPTAISDFNDPLWCILRSFKPIAFTATGQGTGSAKSGPRRNGGPPGT